MPRTSVVIALLVVIQGSATAQTLAEVMENYFAKIGGKEKISSINSSKESSSNWFNSNSILNKKSQSSPTFNVNTIIQFPVFKKFESYDEKGNISNEFFYNDKEFVQVSGNYLNRERRTPVRIEISVATELLKLYNDFNLRLDSEGQLNGSDYYIVRTANQNSTELFYFNKQTYLLDARQDLNLPKRMKYYKDYRGTNLALHPFLYETYDQDILIYKQATETFEFNPEIDKSIFYFDQREYEKRFEPKVKYESTKLEAKDLDLPSFIRSNFEGDRVFIDLWATWCGPCKKEFQNYDSAYYSLMDKYKIHLLYLSIDKASDKKKWEADIKKLNLKGYHTLANEKLMKSIQQLVYNDEAVVIPRYILIDETGSFLSLDFKRPSDPEFRSNIADHFQK